VLPFLTEFLTGAFIIACALLWWQHELDLRAFRKDFEEMRAELEKAGILLGKNGGKDAVIR
jgi:DNA-binding transcriptional regulator of glucitol operon